MIYRVTYTRDVEAKDPFAAIQQADDGKGGGHWEAHPVRAGAPTLTDFERALRAARDAANGDSNDEEIQALQDALAIAASVLGVEDGQRS